MEIYDFILRTTEDAGKLLIHLRDEGFRTSSKGVDVRDVVTSVDTAVNQFVIDAIKEAYPTHAIYSEEGSGKDGDNVYQWTIDPIDGSANFSRGIPHFAVCIGLLENGIPVAGAVYNPVTVDLFSFQQGKGAFLRGKPISVTKATDLSSAHVLFHAGRKRELQTWGGESYRRLLGSVRKTSNFASSSLDACFVAAGRIEANIYGTLSTLDIAAAIGILTESGGVVANAQGEAPAFSKDPQKIYMANNILMLDRIRTLLEDPLG